MAMESHVLPWRLARRARPSGRCPHLVGDESAALVINQIPVHEPAGNGLAKTFGLFSGRRSRNTQISDRKTRSRGQPPRSGKVVCVRWRGYPDPASNDGRLAGQMVAPGLRGVAGRRLPTRCGGSKAGGRKLAMW